MRLIPITLIILIFTTCKSQQEVWNTYKGYWAETEWNFTFYNNGKFKRVSHGHYGNTEVKGRYEIRQDTIEILKGFKDTHGTVGQYYLIDGDSCIIDIDSRYDYCNDKIEYNSFEIDGEIYINNSSRKRNFKYPQVPINDKLHQQQIGSLLAKIVHLDTLAKFVNSEGVIIEEYFEINHINFNNQLKSEGIKLLSVDEIKTQNIENYIRIDDFNINGNNANVRLEFFLIKNRKQGHSYYPSKDIFIKCRLGKEWEIIEIFQSKNLNE